VGPRTGRPDFLLPAGCGDGQAPELVLGAIAGSQGTRLLGKCPSFPAKGIARSIAHKRGGTAARRSLRSTLARCGVPHVALGVAGQSWNPSYRCRNITAKARKTW